MGKPIEVTRLDYSAKELRELASHERDGAVVRRLLAIAAVLSPLPAATSRAWMAPSPLVNSITTHPRIAFSPA